MVRSPTKFVESGTPSVLQASMDFSMLLSSCIGGLGSSRRTNQRIACLQNMNFLLKMSRGFFLI